MEWWGHVKRDLDSTVDRMVFHYVRAQDSNEDWKAGSEFEKKAKACAGDVLAPPRRPKNFEVSPIKGIRKDWFCFTVAGTDSVFVRRLSCHCHACTSEPDVLVAQRTCTNIVVCGKWKEVRSVVSRQIRGVGARFERNKRLAAGCEAGELVGLEGADEPEGFTWRLAMVVDRRQHTGAKIKRDGTAFKPGDWYVRTRQYDRSPLTSSTVFVVDEAIRWVHETAVCCSGIKEAARRRSSRSHAGSRTKERVVLDDAEVRRVEQSVYAEAEEDAGAQPAAPRRRSKRKSAGSAVAASKRKKPGAAAAASKQQKSGAAAKQQATSKKRKRNGK